MTTEQQFCQQFFNEQKITPHHGGVLHRGPTRIHAVRSERHSFFFRQRIYNLYG
ncbi:MAG: hypothetical protein K0S90_2213 [Enterobacteriaceae bacterium]|nr:hypothetical protein [Enterobacteriaceae bacterium]